jgi:hypothetical protein
MTNSHTKLKLLEKYASKPVTTFMQTDCFVDNPPSGVALRGDADGDAVMTGSTQELMSTCPPVRILIPTSPMPDRQQAARLLRKIADELEHGDPIAFVNEQLRKTEPLPPEKDNGSTFAIVPLTAAERRDLEHRVLEQFLPSQWFGVADVKEALAKAERCTAGELLRRAAGLNVPDKRPVSADDIPY